MPYNSKHYLVAFGGTLFQNEIWTTTVRLCTAAEPPASDMVDYAEAQMGAVAAKVQTYFGNVSLWSSATKLIWCRFNAINLDGKYVDTGGSNYFEYSSPSIGSGTVNFPPQVCVVASLRTAAERGRAHAGRMYLPYLGVPLDSSKGGMGAAFPATIASNTAGLLTSLNALPQSIMPDVPKVTIMSKVGNGTKHRVTGVRCGVTLDTMRSRRSSIPETYSTPVSVT